MSNPIGPSPPPAPPVVVPPPTTMGFFPGWVTAVGFLLISLSLLLLSVDVLRNPAPPIAAPDGAGKGPVRPGPAPPPVAPVLPPVDRPPVVPASRTEVARAAVAYRDGLGASFAEMKRKIKRKELTKVDTIGEAFRENGMSLANPLHAKILTYCDAAGNVTDPDGLADEMGAVADALGAK